MTKDYNPAPGEIDKRQAFRSATTAFIRRADRSYTEKLEACDRLLSILYSLPEELDYLGRLLLESNSLSFHEFRAFLSGIDNNDAFNRLSLPALKSADAAADYILRHQANGDSRGAQFYDLFPPFLKSQIDIAITKKTSPVEKRDEGNTPEKRRNDEANHILQSIVEAIEQKAPQPSTGQSFLAGLEKKVFSGGQSITFTNQQNKQVTKLIPTTAAKIYGIAHAKDKKPVEKVNEIRGLLTTLRDKKRHSEEMMTFYNELKRIVNDSNPTLTATTPTPRP